jgi:IS30 family transposase
MTKRYWKFDERKQLQSLLQEGLSITEISKIMNRHHSTIYPEISNGGGRMFYDAEKVQLIMNERARQRDLKRVETFKKNRLEGKKNKIDIVLEELKIIKEMLNDSKDKRVQ